MDRKRLSFGLLWIDRIYEVFGPRMAHICFRGAAELWTELNRGGRSGREGGEAHCFSISAGIECNLCNL